LVASFIDFGSDAGFFGLLDFGFFKDFWTWLFWMLGLGFSDFWIWFFWTFGFGFSGLLDFGFSDIGL